MPINYETFGSGGLSYVLTKLKDKLDTLLSGKVSKTGDSMSGNLETSADIKFTAKSKGLWGIDHDNNAYPYIRDNGTNINSTINVERMVSAGTVKPASSPLNKVLSKK